MTEAGLLPAEPILVVDDNPHNVTAIRSSIEGLPVRIVTAASGEQALLEVFRHDFALIVLDVRMPTMDGFETARLIRGREKSCDTPIIFVTAYDRNDAEVVTAYELGAVDFLFKPIIPSVLRTKVSVFVALRQHQRREQQRQIVEERQRWEAEAMLRRDRAKDNFLAMLGHELRNPLTPLVTGLELIRPHTAVDPAAARIHEIMQRQVKQLGRLVDDLLDISRITSGKIELKLEDVDFSSIIAKAMEAWKPSLAHRTVTVALPEQPLMVRGDAARLTQILINLVQNALNFTEHGGRISVECERGDGEAILRVSDDGIGVPPELSDQIFQMYVQQKPTKDGLGLGLALVKRLLEMHGGTIALEQMEQRGTRFAVHLPLITIAAEASPEPPRALKPERRSVRVVIIEDNDDNREMLSQLLEAEGHQVLSASDGRSGIDLVLSARPDAAVIDIGLPDISGYDVARQVRLQMSDIRMIALTGFGQQKDKEAALAAGFDLHMAKPPVIEALLRFLVKD